MPFFTDFLLRKIVIMVLVLVFMVLVIGRANPKAPVERFIQARQTYFSKRPVGGASAQRGQITFGPLQS